MNFRRTALLVVAAASLCGCPDDPTAPTIPGLDCSYDKIMFYCSAEGQACGSDTPCCGAMWCDAVAGTCTDGNTRVPPGSRCSNSETLCSQGSACYRNICTRDGFLSGFGQACNTSADCAGTLSCDPLTLTCSDGIHSVGPGERCSPSRTPCAADAVVNGERRPLFCQYNEDEQTRVCQWAPYCAE